MAVQRDLRLLTSVESPEEISFAEEEMKRLSHASLDSLINDPFES